MKILLVDNLDSFTYLIASILEELKCQVIVRRNKITESLLSDISAILISPGPGTPENAHISKKTLELAGGKIPILGICLGMQVILSLKQNKILKLTPPIHGKRRDIFHREHFLFKGLPSPFKGALYHSLGFYPPIKEFDVIAWDRRGVVMGISHKHLQIFGVQFHPESFLTESGKRIYKNFIGYISKWKEKG